MFAPINGRPFLHLLPALLCGLLLCATCGQAQAQSDEQKAQAKAHYLKGKVAFDAEDYDTALTEYTEAYQRLPLPGFLFNIGQCYRNLKSYQEAINSFNLYLEAAPGAKNRSSVEKLIKELEVQVKAAADAPKVDDPDKVKVDDPDKVKVDDPDRVADDAPVYKPEQDKGLSPTDPRPVPKGKKPVTTPIYKRWWFWTVVGAVVAGGAATGIYFGTQGGANIPGSALGVADYSR